MGDAQPVERAADFGDAVLVPFAFQIAVFQMADAGAGPRGNGGWERRRKNEAAGKGADEIAQIA